jgi:hypothetical protein
MIYKISLTKEQIEDLIYALNNRMSIVGRNKDLMNLLNYLEATII